MSIRYHRRKKVLPGVWLNFGKNGISTTIGMRGANVNFSSRGTYLNTGIPGTGLSQRIRLDHKKNFDADDVPDNNIPDESIQATDEDSDEIKSSSTDAITSPGLTALKDTLLEAHKEKELLRSELKAAQTSLFYAKLIRLISYVLIFGFFVPWFKSNVNEKKGHVSELEAQLADCRVHVDVSAEPAFENAYNSLYGSFTGLQTCQYKWGIISETQVDRASTRSYASASLDRKQIIADLQQSDIVKTDKQPFHFQTASGNNLYFYPGFIVYIDKKNSFGLIDIKELQVEFSPVRFVETRTPPKDSKQVDTTWVKVNKNGTPDKRFKGNHQIPVMLYGELNLKSQSGLNEMLMFSDYDKSNVFTQNILAFKAELK